MISSLQLSAHWKALPEPSRAALAARAGWIQKARPQQLTPHGDWATWLILAGRGWGKTRTGAEDAAWYALSTPGARIAVIAPTYSDARDTCIEGESGLRGIIPFQCVEAWNRSLGELILNNGSRFKLFGAEEPERLRGPQHHRAWADELGAWRYPETWDQMLFGLRLGESPRAIVTTTPKPTSIIRTLAKNPKTIVTKGSTFDNAANLAPSALAQLRDKYEGTKLGRQELNAEILEEAEGALWNRAMIERARLKDAPPAFRRVVVAVDPAVTNKAESNLTGIVAAARGVDGRGYVLADASGRYSPDTWARKAVEQFDSLQADRIVAEGNQGGDLVTHTIQSVRENCPVTIVHASRGKQARAEPIAALYEQNKISHVGTFSELEDQMATWEPLGDQPSPDRIDALVWALTELMINLPPYDSSLDWGNCPVLC
jgi:phage terminase large subunit-like protein